MVIIKFGDYMFIKFGVSLQLHMNRAYVYTSIDKMEAIIFFA